MIPVHILGVDQDIRELDDIVLGPNHAAGMYYVVGSNGLFLRKVNSLYASTQKADKVSCAGEAKEFCNTLFSAMPRRILDEMTAFAKAIYDRDKAEAAAVMYYHPDSDEWSWDVPDQETTPNGLSVDYKEPPPPPPGSILFGSFHSHADSGAFQSGTDHKDEKNFDGIHVTVGKLGGVPEYHVRFVVGGNIWSVDDQSILIQQIVPFALPVKPEHLARVRTRSFASSSGSSFQVHKNREFSEIIPLPEEKPPEDTFKQGVWDERAKARLSPMAAKDTGLYGPGELCWWGGEVFVKASGKDKNRWKLLTKTIRAEMHRNWGLLTKWEREDILEAMSDDELRRYLVNGGRMSSLLKICQKRTSREDRRPETAGAITKIHGMTDEEWQEWEKGQWGGLE
jgi:hypothetical protein